MKRVNQSNMFNQILTSFQAALDAFKPFGMLTGRNDLYVFLSVSVLNASLIRHHLFLNEFFIIFSFFAFISVLFLILSSVHHDQTLFPSYISFVSFMFFHESV